MFNGSAEFTELILDACRYWERMRIPYNLVLATLSIAFWGQEMLSFGATGIIGGVLVLMFFGAAANVCYCAAYPADILFQLTPMRPYRQYGRWLLFVCGLTFASACALYVLLGDHMV